MNPLEKQLAEDGKRLARNVPHPADLAERISQQLPNEIQNKQIDSGRPMLYALAASILLAVAGVLWFGNQQSEPTPDTITVDLEPLAQPEQLLSEELDLLEQDIESFRQEVTEELSFLL